MVAGVLFIASPFIYLGAYFVWEIWKDHLKSYRYWKRAAINSDIGANKRDLVLSSSEYHKENHA